jgi:hypothetical protein
MSAVQCPQCHAIMSGGAAACGKCGCPLVGPDKRAAASAAVATAPPRGKVKIVSYDCPRCGGRGRTRDRNLLPWNNMAAFAVLLGVTGLIGSACLDENRKALLLGGAVMSVLGVGLYIAGDACNECMGSGKFQRLEIPGRTGSAHAGPPPVSYVGVATNPELPQPAKPSPPPPPPVAETDDAADADSAD